MVKILQAYNFSKQNTFALSGDILAATLIDNQYIAISSAEQFIEIYEIGGHPCCISPGYATTIFSNTNGQVALANKTVTNTTNCNDDENNEGMPGKYMLATVGEVVNMFYCKFGKYLMTLEKETKATPIQSNLSSINCTGNSNSNSVNVVEDAKMFVRIYTNLWQFPKAKLIDLNITIRIASMTTPNAPLQSSIDVIELPLRSPPDLIQCCQMSGNMIVSSKERIYLYEYTQCVHEGTQPRFTYIDFLPFKFFINLNFIPLKICLVENVIACMDNRYCVAFRVVDSVAGSQCLDGKSPAVSDSEYIRNGYSAGMDDAEDAEEAVSNSASTPISKLSLDPTSYSHNNSFETDSFEITASTQPTGICNDRAPVDFNVARMINSVHGHEFEVDIRSQWDMEDTDRDNNSSCVNGKQNISYDTQDIVIMPARANEIKIKLIDEAKAMNVQRITVSNQSRKFANEESSREVGEYRVQYEIRKLLQICMKTIEPGGGRLMDILRCIDLKAIYQRLMDDNIKNQNDLDDYDMGNQQIPSAITTSKPRNRRTLKSNQYQSCVGFALLVASSVDGYLYQFCAQGKWYNENEKPIATYSFTAPILNVHINDYVIFAITTESVEVHTSRIGQKLFSNRFEYPTLAKQYAEESSPDVNAPVAVLGLYTFINVQYICADQDKLILISNGAITSGLLANNIEMNHSMALKKKSNENKRHLTSRLIVEAKLKHHLRHLSSSHETANQVSNPEWTLYSLQIPSIEQIIEDLDLIGETFRSANSNNYYDIMEEAHVMLRMSLSLQLQPMNEDRELYLRSKFLDSCHKLANFCVISRKKEIYLQASGFYKMCNMKLPDIYVNYVNKLLHSNDCSNGWQPLDRRNACLPRCTPEHLEGLTYTLKFFLLDVEAYRYRSSFINQLVKPFFVLYHSNNYNGSRRNSRSYSNVGSSEVSLALEFLHLFIEYSPSDIPQVMLESAIVADSISSEIIDYLKHLDELTAEENLLLAVAACRMSNYILSQQVIENSSRHDLAVALIKYKSVLFDDSTSLFHKVKRTWNESEHENSYKNQHYSFGMSTKSNSEVGNNSQQTDTTMQIVSFSDFTETILLAIEKDDLIEAISDVFIHAVCVEHSISLELLLQLFLNYIAAHVGQKGYQTSQKIFVNILQVYYYNILDVNPLNDNNDLTLNTPHHPHNNNHQQQQQQQQQQMQNTAITAGAGGAGAATATATAENENNDCNSSKANNERETESTINSNADSISAASLSIEDQRSYGQYNRIVYNPLLEQQSSSKQNSTSSPSSSFLQNVEEQSVDSEINDRGLKILLRLYLGRLKILSDVVNDVPSDDIEQLVVNDEYNNLRMDCIAFMAHNFYEARLQKKELLNSTNLNQFYYSNCTRSHNSYIDRNSTLVPCLPNYDLNGVDFEQHIASYKRPITCLMDRPTYLNYLHPFHRNDFSSLAMEEGEIGARFLGWHNELLTLILKIQSLLSYPKIKQDIIEEFVAFLQKTPNLIGIDSFLVIILPKNLAINYMLTIAPEYLYQYGKSHNFVPKQWESLFKKLLNRKDLIPNWEKYINDILNKLVVDLSFEDLLQCFPADVIENSSSELWSETYIADEMKSMLANSDNIVSHEISPRQCHRRRHNLRQSTDTDFCGKPNLFPMDNIDEGNVFEVTLRKAVSKQRNIALHSMIESTGKQLLEATHNAMFHL